MTLLSAYRGAYGERPGWFLEFTYNFDEIEELKRLVPHGDSKGQARKWCDERGEHGEWWIASEYIERCLTLWPGLQAHLQASPLPGFE